MNLKLVSQKLTKYRKVENILATPNTRINTKNLQNGRKTYESINARVIQNVNGNAVIYNWAVDHNSGIVSIDNRHGSCSYNGRHKYKQNKKNPGNIEIK